LQVTASPVLTPKIINSMMLLWIFYGMDIDILPILAIMSIQLANIMKSCLVTKRRNVLQAGAN